jgi:uncharacterized Zn finger protein
MSWRDFDYFPPSKPRAAKGGIKAQSRKGEFGETWWARRWIAVLESFQIGARLKRGRSYARRGQVLKIRIEAGLITAQVQGSRPRPYAVEIKVKTLARTDTSKLGKALAQQAAFAAKLLAGQMPQDIEQAFAAAGLSLFPGALRDLHTECSCPDVANPCKHIAAVYYLVGEEFDRDPFLIFRLRGVDRDQLMAALHEDEGDEAAATGTSRRRMRKSTPRESGAHAAPPTSVASEPLSAGPRVFWLGSEMPAQFFGQWAGENQAPLLQAALAKRLGNFPFWRGNERFLDALAPLYERTFQRAREAVVLVTEEKSPGGVRKGRKHVRGG